MALHGTRLILLEFGIAAFGMIALGLFILVKSYAPLGTYIFLIGVNYVPLLIIAIQLIRNPEKFKITNRSELISDARRLGIQQGFILVPLAIPLLTIFQRPSAGTTEGESKPNS